MPALEQIQNHVRVDDDRSVDAGARWRSGLDALWTLVPGAAMVGLVALLATVLGGVVPVVGSPMIAIIVGIVLAVVLKPSVRYKPGIGFASKRVLQASVVVLGFGLSLTQVLSTGTQSLPVLVGTLVAALLMAWLAGRALGLRTDLRTLIGVGTAICGASAIAATDAVIDADEADVSYAIATIFIFNVVAVLLYPSIGRALGFSQHSFGLWTGTAVNDLSSVVAASTVYGHTATTYGVIVKLTRTLAIVPICLGLAVLRGRRRQAAIGTCPSRRIELRRIVPLFILAFLVAVLLNTLGVIPPAWHARGAVLSTWMITAALAGIGLSTNVTQIRSAGLRPFALGAILWLSVGLASLGLQWASGTL